MHSVPVPLGSHKPTVGDGQIQPGAAASHRNVEDVRDVWRSHIGSMTDLFQDGGLALRQKEVELS